MKYYYRIIANTSRHAHARARAHTHTAIAAVQVIGTYRYSMGRSPNRDGPLRGRQCRSLAIKINLALAAVFLRGYGCFCVYKNLGRTETRTRDRMYCRSIRTVRDISRDDRARIATCSLRTSTDRHKENYSIDRLVHTRNGVFL